MPVLRIPINQAWPSFKVLGVQVNAVQIPDVTDQMERRIMLLMEVIRKIAFEVQAKRRKVRFQIFLNVMDPHQKELVLDLGGGSGNYFVSIYSYKGQLILVDKNLRSVIEAKKQFPSIIAIAADGCNSPFRDKSISVIFCNSVIEEHVALQEDFAKEIQRAGKSYFVQTPSKYFLMDSHYLIPLFQFLPKFLQRLIYEKFGGGWWKMKSRQYEDICYLSARRLRQLFPDSKIEREKFLWLTKSFYCYNRGIKNRR